MKNEFTQYTCVAFYGFAVTASTAVHCYERMLQWFAQKGCPPDRMGVKGEGFSGKLLDFSRPSAKLKKNGFRGVASVEIHSKPPSECPTSVDGRMMADLSIVREYAILSAESLLVPFEAMLDIAHAVVQHLKPCYGIGYQRNRRLGPSFYALGINYGTQGVFSGPEYEEKVRISSWIEGMSQHVYRQGLLRDVYPYNFLTEAHLFRNVAGLPLNEWIQKDSGRGRLVPFSGNMSLWSVDQVAIPQVCEDLHREGIIFDAMRHLNL